MLHNITRKETKMKKLLTVLLFTVLSLSLLCSCGSSKTGNSADSSASEASAAVALTTEQFFSINSGKELVKNHKCYTLEEKFSILDYSCISYADNTLYCSSQGSYANCYIGNSTIIYTDGSASEILYNYYLSITNGTVTISDDHGDILDSPEAELTSCTKNDSGYDAELRTDVVGVISYSANCIEREYCDGDYVRYDAKLNGSFEILSIDTYYVPVDGSEPILVKTTRVEYDSDTLPDFVNNILASVSGEKYKIAFVYNDGSTDETTIYGKNLMLETDCEAYYDAEFTESVESAESYMYNKYELNVVEDTTLYLKLPSSD